MIAVYLCPGVAFGCSSRWSRARVIIHSLKRERERDRTGQGRGASGRTLKLAGQGAWVGEREAKSRILQGRAGLMKTDQFGQGTNVCMITNSAGKKGNNVHHWTMGSGYFVQSEFLSTKKTHTDK